MTETSDRDTAPGTRGHVLHWAAGYDLLAWLLLLGRERAFRRRLVDLARLEPGQSVLDVGCGTGTLAIEAKRRVGPSGAVQGVDPSPEMIARARKKAAKAGLNVTFTKGVVEALPIADGQFDVVLSTLMLHHLPGEERRQCAREIGRMLKPGGRALVVDFGEPTREGRSFIDHFHWHGGVDVREIAALLSEAGLEVVETGPVGLLHLDFVLATAR